MKITEVRLGKISVPLRVPFKTALRSVSAVEDIIIEIHTDTGEIGYGEAPPTAAVTGETEETIVRALKAHIIGGILGRNVDEPEDLLDAVQSAVPGNHSAKAAADMAIWDLYGQLCRLPVFKLLGGAGRELTNDITISVNDPAEMAHDAADAVGRGFNTLKVKVGINPELDISRLTAIREAVGADPTIRIDANQAWKPKEAVRLLNAMQDKGLNIELVEQPVPAPDIEGLKYVTDHSSIPVLADESVFSPMDAMRVLGMHAADYINIKLMKCGGITDALRIISAAEVYGVECMMGSMLEARVSVNAAVHIASAKKIVTKVDLDGPVLCTEDPVIGGAVFSGESIRVSAEPGLGIRGIEGIRYIDED